MIDGTAKDVAINFGGGRSKPPLRHSFPSAHDPQHAEFSRELLLPP